MYFLAFRLTHALSDSNSRFTSAAYRLTLILSSVSTTWPSTSASVRNGAKREAYSLAPTKPRSMTKDCRPLRRFLHVATSATFAIASGSLRNRGALRKACLMLSPIPQARFSNGYHSGAPHIASEGGSVAGHSFGASLSASSQAAMTSFADSGTGYIAKTLPDAVERDQVRRRFCCSLGGTES